MPHLKSTILSLLAAISLVGAALAATAASDRVIDATKAGVVGDGATLNTAGIQKAIDDCAAAGGGTIRFPPGRYLTGTIQIKSNVTLRLDEGATLLGSADAADYRNLDPFIDGSGNPMGHALVVAVDANNVGIEGTGTVDGQGPKLKARQNPYTIRPFLLRWVRCTNVTVRDVHLRNPGAWTLNFFQTKGALVEGVIIRCRGLGLHNNDGINLDSSENVRVRNCDVISGDDALVIKSTSARPSRDIVASDCQLSTRTNAIKLGTESLGGFENISVSNCRISNTQMAGIALYEVDGGDLRNVTVSDITMDGVTMPISVRLGSRLKTFREGDKPKQTAGTLRDVTIKNVTAKNIEMIGMLINGVPGHPVEALTLENIQLDLPGGGTTEAAKVQLPEKEKDYPEFDMFGKTMPAYGIYARHVRGLKLQNVRTSLRKPDARPAAVFIDVEGLTPANFATESPVSASGEIRTATSATAAAGRASIADFGAIGDGTTLNTERIQAAIDQLGAKGGGTIVVPEGVFLSGAIFLKPGVNLHLEKGAVLKGSTDRKDYPKTKSRIEGHFEPWLPALINADKCDHLCISGSGTLDGNGQVFWGAFWDARRQNPRVTNLAVERPRLVFIQNSSDVQISGITFKDSGFWNLHLYRSSDVSVENARFEAPYGEPPNRAASSDGVDIDSCQRVTVRGCSFAVCDDCVCLKGTKGPFALDDEDSPPVEHIRVTDCTFEAGHGVVTLGSEATVVRDVVVENCRVTGKIPLVRLKLRPDTPQHYEDIHYRSIKLAGDGAIFEIKPWTQFFDLQGQPPPSSVVRNVTLTDIKGSFGSFGAIVGNPKTTISDIMLEGIDVTLKNGKLEVGKVNNLAAKDVVVNGKPFSLKTAE